MWKNLSFKKQLILILLIPITGLLYFNISNLFETYKNYIRIENSLENLNEIAALSKIKSQTSDERILYEYSTFDKKIKAEFQSKVQENASLFSNFSTNDSTIKKNIEIANGILNDIHNSVNDTTITSIALYKKYTTINTILNNLIEKDIIDCDDINISKLANNLKSYIDSKASINLIRGIVLDKLTNDKIDPELLIYYQSCPK